MKTTLVVKLSPEGFNVLAGASGQGTAGAPYISLDVKYSRAVAADDDSAPEVVVQTDRVTFGSAGSQTLELGTIEGETFDIAILGSDGSVAAVRSVKAAQRTEYAISKEDIKAVRAAQPSATAPPSVMMTRRAQLVAIGNVVPKYSDSRIAVHAVSKAGELEADGPLRALGFRKDLSSAVELTAEQADSLRQLAWGEAHLGVDGRFSPAFERPFAAGTVEPTVGWAWWLTGSRSIAGFVKDDLALPRRDTIIIPLPALQANESPEGTAPVDQSCECEPPKRPVPADVTEAEVVNNPQVYSEDPGAFCKPFSNPERVLNEKAFAVVARVQQPDIGPMGSVRVHTQHLLDLDLGSHMAIARDLPSGATMIAQPLGRDALAAALLGAGKPKAVRPTKAEVQAQQQLSSGRTLMDARHPVQWEGDIARYQASTVALGHILEFRVRTRSNGYSLGNVASTLTLAPRQTKRIQKIEFERLERASREELTQQADSVSDELTRERDYSDTVAAYLDEWATGSSSSGTAAAAGGIGFAIPPVVGGVGGGTSKAWSESTQEGTRNTGASEQQRLRDAIRRHGDSLRRLQSTVVTEITQQESVTGTTEVLRNPNYGHSLTVIYYQILRHLKVSTEFAGVRECLFVPFAIKPFTLQRAYRWREAIEQYVRSGRFKPALKHLRDVATDFQFSSLIPGSRAQQKLTYLRGSFYLKLGVERPRDTADDKFDALRWQLFAPYLGAPAHGIWARLAEAALAQRDHVFQREYAPVIAAKWVNALRIEVGGVSLQADCTMATQYLFNGTVRVDFSVPAHVARQYSRAQLHEIRVVANDALPAGSVAIVNRMTVRYGTANFERTIDGLAGANDLVTPGSGEADAGALLGFPLDAWDHVDEQLQMKQSVNELIEHLNAHVEYYHKAIWWCMDRDRLFMLLDGFYVPGTNQVSIASVVDREPVAIIGNSLVYRVGGGTFLGLGEMRTPAQLYDAYAGREPAQDPLLVSLPTGGLYAQTIMDECLALEEHQGSVDWVLADPDPELGNIDPSLLASRRADLAATVAPTAMPGTIINLQNAPEAPAVSGLRDALSAAGNADAFRDMAGLAGTQANAAAALQSAASLATNFGNQAAALKLAELADKEKARAAANPQIAAVKSAQDKGLITAEQASDHTNRILEQMHSGKTRTAPHENDAFSAAIDRVGRSGAGGLVEAATSDGAVRAQFASSAEIVEPEVEAFDLIPGGDSTDEVVTVESDEQWVILVAGYNYLNQTRGTTTYGTYARNRAALLLVTNPAWQSNTKLRFLLVNVGEGKAYVDNRSAGSLADARNWKQTGELRFASNGDSVPLRFHAIGPSDYPGDRFVYPTEVENGLLTPAGWEDEPVFSIVHWYQLLRAFGRGAAGTVMEASVFSHGNPFGPILVNSYRDSAFMSQSDYLNLAQGNRQRDPADVDGRADADFVEPNLSAADLGDIHKAFAADGHVWLWGCAALGPFKRMVLNLYKQSGFKADGTTPDTSTFKFNFEFPPQTMQNLQTWLGNPAFLPATGNTTQGSLGDFKAFLDLFLGTVYAERLAKAFRVKCFATALGTGSEPDAGARFVTHRVSPIYEKVVAFYENYMRFKRDTEGRRYVNYRR